MTNDSPKTAKKIRRELEALLRDHSGDPDVLLRYWAANSGQADTIRLILREYSQGMIPSRVEAALSMLNIELDTERLKDIEKDFARDNELKTLLESLDVLEIVVPEGGGGPLWGQLTPYGILGILPDRDRLPPGTILTSEPLRELGRQKLVVQLPTGVQATIQINAKCNTTDLPADLKSDIALLGVEKSPLKEAISDEPLKQSPPLMMVRTVLGRLVTLQEHGYSKSRQYSKLMSKYQEMVNAAKCEYVRNKVASVLKSRGTGSHISVAIDTGDNPEHILRAQAEEIVSVVRVSSGSIPVQFKVGRYDPQTKTITCTLFQGDEEAGRFTLRSQPSWLPRFLQDDLAGLIPLDPPGDSDADHTAFFENAIARALNDSAEFRVAPLGQIASSLYRAGKEDTPVARNAIAFYASAKASTLKVPTDRIKYLRLFLSLVFGDPTRRVALATNSEFEYDRLRDFVRLIADVSGKPSSGSAYVVGPLASTAHALVEVVDERDDHVLYRVIQELSDLSPDLLSGVLGAFVSAKGKQSVVEVGFRVLREWLSQKKATSMLTAEALIDVLACAGIVEHFRDQLEQDLIDYFEDTIEYLGGDSSREPREIRDRLTGHEKSLSLIIDESSKGGTRPLLEEAKYLHDVLALARKRIDERSQDLFGVADLSVVCDTRVAILGRDSKVHLTISNRGGGLASRVTVSPSVSSPHRLFEVPGEIPPLSGGEVRGITLAIATMGVEPILLSIVLTFSDQTAHGKTTKARFEVQVIRPEEFRRIPKVYTPGQPCADPSLFVGRADVLKQIAHTLAGERGNPLVLLHGKRRLGKTSVLAQLRGAIQKRSLDREYGATLRGFLTTAYCDLESVQKQHSTKFVKTKLLTEIGEALQGVGHHPLPIPPLSLTDEEFDLAVSQWIGAVATMLREYSYRLLTLVDEFDQLLMVRSEDTGLDGWLRELLLRHGDVLSFVYAGADRLITMMQDRSQRLFGMAGAPIELFALERDEARDLATRPILDKEPDFEWREEALETFLTICGGNPYYIHYLGDRIVELCNRECRLRVQRSDIDDVVAETIASLPGVRDELEDLSKEERLVLASLAETAPRGGGVVAVDDGLQQLSAVGVQVSAESFLRHLDRLESLYLVQSNMIGGKKMVYFTSLLLQEFVVRRIGLRTIAISDGFI